MDFPKASETPNICYLPVNMQRNAESWKMAFKIIEAFIWVNVQQVVHGDTTSQSSCVTYI